MGVVVMPPLPPVSSEEVPNSRVPSLHGHYPASSLLRTRPPPSRRRTISRVPRDSRLGTGDTSCRSLQAASPVKVGTVGREYPPGSRVVKDTAASCGGSASLKKDGVRNPHR